MLTGGNAADCRAGEDLLERLPAARIVHADRAYDSNSIRRKIEAAGAMPNIPPKANRIWKSCFSPFLYRGRNAIERMFGRLKDFRRIATRYDRLATHFLAAICMAAGWKVEGRGLRPVRRCSEPSLGVQYPHAQG